MLPKTLGSFLVTGALAAASPTCRRAATGCAAVPSADFTTGAISKNLTTAAGRRYRVFLPESYKQGQETPLILSYHGANRVIEQQIALDRLTDSAFRNDNIIVYMQGNAVSKFYSERAAWRKLTWTGRP